MDQPEINRWVETEMVSKSRIRIIGSMGGGVFPVSEVDASCFAQFHCAQIMHIGGHYVYFQVDYDRSKVNLEAPVMGFLILESKELSALIETHVMQSPKVPMGWFSASRYRQTRPQHFEALISYGSNYAPVLDDDPWMHAHMWVMAQMVRGLDLSTTKSELKPRQLEGVRQMMATSLEHVEANRIRRVLKVRGR